MEVTKALATGRRLLREHGLDDWTIVADRAKTRAGVCRFTKRQIGLSAPLTTLHSEDEVLDTILHEIAHALVGPQHGHDAVWRAKARQIGCSGERCVSSDSPRVPGDWVGRCSAGHEKSRHRAPARLMSCGECSRASTRATCSPGPTGAARRRSPARMPPSSPPCRPPAAPWSRSRRRRGSETSSSSPPARGRGWSGRSSSWGRCAVRCASTTTSWSVCRSSRCGSSRPAPPAGRAA